MYENKQERGCGGLVRAMLDARTQIISLGLPRFRVVRLGPRSNVFIYVMLHVWRGINRAKSRIRPMRRARVSGQLESLAAYYWTDMDEVIASRISGAKISVAFDCRCAVLGVGLVYTDG
jgi:hypothetical protein